MKKKFPAVLILLCLLMLTAPVSVQAAPYRYYRSRLSGFDRRMYDALLKGWASGRKAVSITAKGTDSIHSEVLSCLINDNPRLYWIRGARVTVTRMKKGKYRITFSMRQNWKNAVRSRSRLKSRLKRTVRRLRKACRGKSAAEKAGIIHDYIIKNCAYGDSKYDQTVYGVLLKKKAVCAGYARTYKLLCDELGVTCICVGGTVNGVNHLLNYVRIRGKWYYVDTTWDDTGSPGSVSRRFFLLGSADSGCHITRYLRVSLPVLSAASLDAG